MSYLTLTTKNFNETVDNNDIVIVYFWAEWCAPCKQFAPTYTKLAEENAVSNPDVVFAKVNIDDQSVIAKHYNVFSVPTLLVLRQGIILMNQGGMLPEESFADMIEHVQNLDMDKIREELDEEE